MIKSLTILSPSLVYVETFYTFISCIWNTQYYGPGEFEFVVEYSEENLSSLAIGNYIVKNNTEQIAVIEKIRYDYTPEEGGTITASGRMAISLLDRRLIYSWSNNKPSIVTWCVDGQRVEEAASNTVNSIAIHPSAGGTARVIPNLDRESWHGYTETSGKRVSTYQNLYDALTAFLGQYKMGHRINYDKDTNTIRYEVYKGADKSGTLVFSQQLQNLLSFAYEDDSENLKTVAYIGGDGEGLDRFVTDGSLNGGGTQLNRRELFFDATSERQTGETAANYSLILQEEAKASAREYARTKTVEAEIDLVNSGYEYGTDYNVGDIILISDIVNFKPRITTIIESQSADGYTIDVEFNEDAPEEETE